MALTVKWIKEGLGNFKRRERETERERERQRERQRERDRERELALRWCKQRYDNNVKTDLRKVNKWNMNMWINAIRVQIKFEYW